MAKIPRISTAQAECIRGLENTLSDGDDVDLLLNRFWIPSVGGVRKPDHGLTLVLKTIHCWSTFSGGERCSKIKAEHQKLLRIIQQPEIPEYRLSKSLTLTYSLKIYKRRELAWIPTPISSKRIVASHGVDGSVRLVRKGKLQAWHHDMLDRIEIVECVESVVIGAEVSPRNELCPRHPIEIVERDVKKLKRRTISLVKVRWNSRKGAEYTWEREDQFRKKYPNLFSETVPSSRVAT
ncbi:hypothetical protein Tco_1578299 [Tanacetum coccineum]